MTQKILPVALITAAVSLAGCKSNRDVLPPEAWQPAPAQPQGPAPIDQAGTVPPPGATVFAYRVRDPERGRIASAVVVKTPFYKRAK